MVAHDLQPPAGVGAAAGAARPATRAAALHALPLAFGALAADARVYSAPAWRSDALAAGGGLASIHSHFISRVEGGAQADERFAMLGLSGRGEVLDFVGVGAEVVELFARAGALHELQGRAGEFSLGQELAHERIDRETFFLVAVE